MAKRKLGASFIILCIAAVTLISGTYAWFLVGGFANLFNLGFDVIEASGGIVLQGDNGSANKVSNAWDTMLVREDFSAFSFIPNGGRYKPVSSADGASFLMVDLKNDEFTSGGVAPSKVDSDIIPEKICYNDFTFRVKSSGEETPGSIEAKTGAYLTITLNGSKVDEDGQEVVPEGDDKEGAAVAARVAVTINGVTTIYSNDGESYQAVTSGFSGAITDANENRIIDAADGSASVAGLTAPVRYEALKSADGTLTKIYLGNLSGDAASATTVRIRVWLEGNDKDCVDFSDRTIAGKSLFTKLSFGVDE